jgi:predicted component of type VI protein secretion system
MKAELHNVETASIKFDYNLDDDNSFIVELKDEALEYMVNVFVATIESRQGKADDPQRAERTAEVLQNLANGIVPQRGSKGSTREPWEAERTVILRSMLQSAGIEIALKGNENVEQAIAKLAAHYKRDLQELKDNLDQRAKDRFQLLNAPL